MGSPKDESLKTSGSGMDHPRRLRLSIVAPNGPRIWYHFVGGLVEDLQGLQFSAWLRAFVSSKHLKKVN